MAELEKSVQKTKTGISALELKQLLLAINKADHICFRFRAVGEMWSTHHMRVAAVNQKSVLLFSDEDKKHILLRINSVMQFDLDERFQNYQPNNHYDVNPSPELD